MSKPFSALQDELIIVDFPEPKRSQKFEMRYLRA